MEAIIIAGLGNPGEKYRDTRHNAGFMAIDRFSGKNDFPLFGFSKKFNALISEKIWEGRKIILAKPQTFMNESGKSVKKLVSSFRFQVPNLIVVHDDIDLPLGKIKISQNRGSAGHKGVESIIKNLGTEDFARLRIGIQPPSGKPKAAEKFVLKKISISKEVLKTASKAISSLIEQGLEKSMSLFNK